MRKVTQVTVLSDYQVDLMFDDGVRGIVDLSELVGKGVFELWRDYDFFRGVRIGTSGELAWSDQVDLCPDSLYLKATGKRPGDLFPALRCEESHA